MKRGRRELDVARRRHPRPHRARNARQPRSRNGAGRGASSGPAEVRQCRPGEGGYAGDLAMAACGTAGAGQLVCRSHPPAASRVCPALGAHACSRHRRYGCRIRRGARRAPEPAALRARTRARRVLDEDRLDARRVPAHTRTDAWVPAGGALPPAGRDAPRRRRARAPGAWCRGIVRAPRCARRRSLARTWIPGGRRRPRRRAGGPAQLWLVAGAGRQSGHHRHIRDARWPPAHRDRRDAARVLVPRSLGPHLDARAAASGLPQLELHTDWSRGAQSGHSGDGGAALATGRDARRAFRLHRAAGQDEGPADHAGARRRARAHAAGAARNARRHRTDPLDRVRQRCRPGARAGRRAVGRVRGSFGARCEPAATGAAADRRGADRGGRRG